MKYSHWTEEKCLEIAKSCSSLVQFRRMNSKAYFAALKHGWIKSYPWFIHRKTKPQGYWTKDRCYEIAKTCSSKYEFRKKCISAHQLAYKKGWLNEWFPQKRYPWGYWNPERCKEIAKKCSNIKEFRKKFPSGYNAAKIHGWNINDVWD